MNLLKLKQYPTVILLLLFGCFCRAGTVKQVPAFPDNQLAETRTERDERMRWWREARFGMFIHWGIYASLAGRWEGQPRNTAEWIQNHARVDSDTYAKAAIPLFKPRQGFAVEWARLAKEDIASKNGNYLLNIGPKPDGSLCPETLKAFRAIGRWMAVNSESIYATTGAPLPTLEWGRATMRRKPDGTTLYLHVFEWPDNGLLRVPIRYTIKNIHLLADPQTKIAFEPAGEETLLRLPTAAPDKIASVIKLEI